MYTNHRSNRLTTTLASAAVLCLAAGIGSMASPANADPAGNNGTVKIAAVGDLDGIPDNTPHVGCAFSIEWYGFDEGADIVSSVSFESQAPTADSVISGTDPSQVFVGGDDASGAGTPEGLDGTATYVLGFTGVPHPEQGYHVKVTVTTPGSQGNYTKSKVFWVEGCEPDTPPTTPPPTTPPPTTTPPATTPPATTPPAVTPPAVTPPTVTPTPSPEVKPAEAVAPQPHGEVKEVKEVKGAQAHHEPQHSTTLLPTAVNAGVPATVDEAPGTSTQRMLGLLMVLLGAATGALAWTRRARG